jgi:hypothetical protein
LKKQFYFHGLYYIKVISSISQSKFVFFYSLSTGDSIFTAGKPAILSNNTLIRSNRPINNRRHHGSSITSSSSTISSVSNNNNNNNNNSSNNEKDKDNKELLYRDKDKEILSDSQQKKYTMDSGNWIFFLFFEF